MAIKSTLFAVGTASQDMAAMAAAGSGNLTKTLQALGAQFSSMNEAQIVNTATMTGLQGNYFKAAVAMSTLSAEQKKSIIDTYNQTIATKAQTGATQQSTAATGGLTVAMKGLRTVMATHPFLTFLTIASVLIPVVTAAYDKWWPTAEKANEALKEQCTVVSTLETELQSLEGEFASNGEKLSELQRLASTGKITPDQKTELQNLLEVNKQLERKIQLHKEVLKAEQAAEEKAALDAYDKTSYKVDVGAGGYSFQGSTQTFQGVAALQAYNTAIADTTAAIDRLEAQYLSGDLAVEEYNRTMALLEQRLSKLRAGAATCAKEQENFADSIYSTEGDAAALREEILKAVDAYIALTQTSGDAANTISDLPPVDVSPYIKSFDTAQEKVSNLRKLQEDLAKRGALTGDFLADLYEILPEAAGKVTTVAEAQDYLSRAILDSKDAAEIAYSGMLVTNQEWLEQNLNVNKTLSSAMAAYCGQDLKNWQDLASAKWKVDQRLVSELSALWAEWMGVSTADIKSRIDAIEASIKAGRYLNAATAELYNELKAVYELRVGLEDAFSRIEFDVPGNAKNVAAYKAEINKLYDAERRLADLQKDYDLIDAKRAMLDEDDLDGQIDAVTKLTGLLNDQNAVLNEQNNIRRKLIQDEIDRLAKLGFEIDYDPQANELNIKNWERLTELQATSLGEHDSLKEATNELKKETEEALEKLMQYNEANVENSLQWWKNLKSIDDLLDEIKDSMQEVRDEQKEQLETVLELVEDMIRQESEDMKEALENQIDD